MTKHEAIIYAKVIGCIIFYGLVLVLLGSVCDFVLEGLEDFFYYTLDFNKGVSTFLSYLILLILCCVVFFAIAISVMAIKEKYPGLRPGNIIEFIKKNPKKRKKALETYLASSDEYSRQVADAYHEICDMRSRFSLAFNDEAKESYTDTLVSPEYQIRNCRTRSESADSITSDINFNFKCMLEYAKRWALLLLSWCFKSCRARIF